MREVGPHAPLRHALLKSRRLATHTDSAHDGGSVHVAKVLEAMVAQGDEVEVFTRREAAGGPPVHTSTRLRTWSVNFDRSKSNDLFLRDYQEGRSFVQSVVSSPAFATPLFDALHIHHWTSGVGLLDYLPRDLPVVFTPHLLPTEKARSNGLSVPQEVAEVERQLLERADLTIAMSSAERDSCLRLGARRVELVPNGVSAGFLACPPSTQLSIERVIQLGTIGRICMQKGTDVLLDAVEVLVEGGLDVRLDIVGPSYDEDLFEAEIRRRVAVGKLAERVRFIGPVSHSLLPSMLADWDIYLQPSRYESQGIALLEAMAAGRRVVATGVPAVLEYLSETTGFLIAAPPSVADLSAAIRKAVESPGTRSVAAREVARRMGWHRTTMELLRHFQGVCEGPWGKRHDTRNETELHREVAASAASAVQQERNTAGVLLIGSSARGAAQPGSDIDLIVFTKSETVGPKVGWSFTDGPPIDVRAIPTSVIFEMAEKPDPAFVESSAVDPLADHLVEALALTALDSDLKEALTQIVGRRMDPSMRRRISARLAAAAGAAFVATSEVAGRGAQADAQVSLNASTQLLLNATLVAEGWLRKGAKRRLETAAMYAATPMVRDAASLLSAAVGIDGLTLRRASELVAARTRLRNEHVSCLETLMAPPDVLAVAKRHAVGTTDYYSPAMDRGFVKGCINHMRSFSGVPLMPETYARVLGITSSHFATEFLRSPRVSEQVRELWEEIMDIASAGRIQGYARDGEAQARSVLKSLAQ